MVNQVTYFITEEVTSTRQIPDPEKEGEFIPEDYQDTIRYQKTAFTSEPDTEDHEAIVERIKDFIDPKYEFESLGEIREFEADIV